MNLIFTSNFTFNTTKQCFSTLLALRLFMKNGSNGWRARCIWTVDFKWLQDVKSLNTFNNCNIIMVNNSDSIRISSVVLLLLLLISELIQQVAMVNFKSFLDILKISKSSLWTFLMFSKNRIKLLKQHTVQTFMISKAKIKFWFIF